ncbi:hypothetical protein Sjap_026348 [Stephania japonica]|uniref:Uncharacterized protein n=1 Tax=Stephania japonica TaxID=461633 RepID=A0AAP0E7T7_9MAGN
MLKEGIGEEMDSLVRVRTNKLQFPPTHNVENLVNHLTHTNTTNLPALYEVYANLLFLEAASPYFTEALRILGQYWSSGG